MLNVLGAIRFQAALAEQRSDVDGVPNCGKAKSDVRRFRTSPFPDFSAAVS
jgi:hypothetical protein